jgi:hypothetical protein
METAMTRTIFAIVGAAMTIATANPALACGGGHTNRSAHQAKAAVAQPASKPAKVEELPAALDPTTGPVQTLSSLQENSKA